MEEEEERTDDAERERRESAMHCTVGRGNQLGCVGKGTRSGANNPRKVRQSD